MTLLPSLGVDPNSTTALCLTGHGSTDAGLACGLSNASLLYSAVVWNEIFSPNSAKSHFVLVPRAFYVGVAEHLLMVVTAWFTMNVNIGMFGSIVWATLLSSASLAPFFHCPSFGLLPIVCGAVL